MTAQPNDSTLPLRQQALECARLRWLLFPIRAMINGQCTCGHSGQSGCKPGKHPAIKEWQKRATADPAQLHKWFTEWPDAGIAIATGRKSNLIVIDCDSPQALEALSKILGGIKPKTMIVKTGKGWHLYFLAPDFLVKTITAVAGIQGLDVRGEGGYVVAAGSPHQSGKTYTIATPGIDPQPLPPKLYDFLKEHCSKERDTSGESVKEEQLIATDGIIQEGGRNDAVTRKVGSLFWQGLAEDQVQEKAHAYNVECCKPPLPPDEVNAIVDSIGKADAKRKAGQEFAKPKRKLKTVQLAYVKMEQTSWLWHQRIPYGKLTVLQGDPGLGKSMVTMAIAAAVTTGKSLPGGPALEPSHVLILACEDGIGDTIKPRLLAAGGDDTRCFVVSGVETDHDREEVLRLPNDIPTLKEFLVTHQVTLVIIDPLSAYLTGKIDSHKDADMRQMLTPLAQLAEETETAIVAIRHLNKGTGSALHRGMGSTAIGAAARSVLLVAEDPEDDTARVLATVKNNLSQKPTSLRFHIEEGSTAGSVKWDGPVDYSADDLVMARREERVKGTEVDAFLTKCLMSGPKHKNAVMSEAREDGLQVSDRTLRRHLEDLGGMVDAGGKPGMWGLAGQVDNQQPHVQDDQTA